MLSVTRAPKTLSSTNASTTLLIESVIFPTAASPACTSDMGIHSISCLVRRKQRFCRISVSNGTKAEVGFDEKARIQVYAEDIWWA